MFRLQQTDFFDQNKLVSVRPRLSQEPFPEHCHSFHELVLVKSGCAPHIAAGGAVHIRRGSVLYRREEDAHFFDQIKNMCLTNVLFKPEEFHSAKRLPRRLQESCHLGRGGFLLSHALQGRSEQRMGLINHLNENDQTEIDSNERSARITIPLRTLNRRIQAHTGLTQNNSLGRVRLCQASWLLGHTQQSVTDIAIECGFNGGNYFPSNVHAAFNMTRCNKESGTTDLYFLASNPELADQKNEGFNQPQA